MVYCVARQRLSRLVGEAHVTRRTSPLLHKLRPQNQAFDPVITAVDFLRVARQPDRLDQRAALQRLARALDRQILDQRHLIAIGQDIADRVAHLEEAK